MFETSTPTEIISPAEISRMRKRSLRTTPALWWRSAAGKDTTTFTTIAEAWNRCCVSGLAEPNASAMPGIMMIDPPIPSIPPRTPATRPTPAVIATSCVVSSIIGAAS